MSKQINISADNALFLESLYQQYLQNKDNVDESWQNYFANLNNSGFAKANNSADEGLAFSDLTLCIKALNLINSYRVYGYTQVQLDPLSLNQPKHRPELDYRYHGITADDLNSSVFIGNELGLSNPSVNELIKELQRLYSSRIAVEFMHIESHEERAWFKDKIENQSYLQDLDQIELKDALEDITKAEMFEHFLHTKFPGVKRFSLEGLEAIIAATQKIIKHAAFMDVQEVIIAMAHRGRLNMLTRVMGKSYHSMISEFKGELAFPEEMGIPGDVKYHLGFSSDKEYSGKMVHLSLMPNPSHLEAVNSVALGKIRAKQDKIKDYDRSKVMGILMHGDAAFAGQGSVMESLALSQLYGYHVGGTIHVVTNNQIGFTTNPTNSRSTNYCTDIAKFICAPVIHVNAEDIASTIAVCKLAVEYRMKFKKDIVIDIVGYRKYGHNEGDEPLYTQPIMYEAIKKKTPVPYLFAKELQNKNVIDSKFFEDMQAQFKQFLEQEYILAQQYKPTEADWLKGDWSSIKIANTKRQDPITGVDEATLKSLGGRLSKYPECFVINPKLARQLEAKDEMLKTGKNLDWAMGEALAFATLLNDGYKIRITGQDVERGTFSHRHAVFTDQQTQSRYIPLNHLHDNQNAKIEIHNSNLSELGVLSFEYGYSIAAPNTLTIWEAQFGDFANGAQVVIDQYISSAESKWLRMSGLVMLLPHGYEGQGPEHSSARPERFLQLCANDNMQVVNCTTPASIYHVLRRQMQSIRKPLIVMSPKSLLRHKLAVSDVKDFASDTKFMQVIDDYKVAVKKVRQVILCSGKVYYDLFEAREANKRDDIAIIRLEQLYPFPEEPLSQVLQKYKDAEIIWCQEEHKNMGYFYFVVHRIEAVLNDIKHKSNKVRYIGRDKSASPAVGYMKLHVKEQQAMMAEIFN